MARSTPSERATPFWSSAERQIIDVSAFQPASFLSLRRGERWLGEAETEWGNHLATAANGHTKGTRRKHHLPLPPKGRPPLRRASLDTSPPIDGGEEGLSSATAAEDGRTG
ncbi:hypothetical protein FJ414_25005 [Mesorhizobium sp. B3-1-6]|nr:hypothetical protein FJ414_25005 [Mesorhizobium sp. B3-1-6]